MPRTTLALTSFTAGELSPKMDGRTDFEKYSSFKNHRKSGVCKRLNR